MYDLFSVPIKTKQFGSTFAYQYANGTINIEGKKYIGYSMTEAIKIHRRNK